MTSRDILEEMKKAIRNDSLYGRKNATVYEMTAPEKELYGCALGGDGNAHAWLMRRFADRFESWDLARLLDFQKLAPSPHLAFDTRLKIAGVFHDILAEKKKACGM